MSIDPHEEMPDDVKKEILVWAQEQVNNWANDEEDWWGAYGDKWDINIWDSEVYGESSQGFGVSAYRLINGGQDTDYCSDVRVGFLVGKEKRDIA
jgi:hypothetical protein